MSRIARLCYLLAGAISVVLGAVYLFSSRFMPYHAVAVGQRWEDVPEAYRVLIGALLDVAGAGWICLGAALILLVVFPLKRGERWARWAAPALILLFYVPVLLATLNVLKGTPATPPWYGVALVCGIAILAVLIDRPWQSPKQNGRQK